MALGFSFAAAGKRVLLIDADLVGRGLTNRLNCEGRAGLLESVSGAGLAPIRQVMKNVSILPAGIGDELGRVSTLPLDELAEVVEAARSRFDLILMDTGPVMASLETPIVAQVADHVILTISHGLQQAVCERSMKILRSVGIKVTGMVFNRAKEKDYRRWIGGNSYYESSASGKRNAVDVDHPAGVGPLAGSVAGGDLAPSNQVATNGVGS
jgi:Mrp family chromosome partitioning ATPase